MVSLYQCTVLSPLLPCYFANSKSKVFKKMINLNKTFPPEVKAPYGLVHVSSSPSTLLISFLVTPLTGQACSAPGPLHLSGTLFPQVEVWFAPWPPSGSGSNQASYYRTLLNQPEHTNNLSPAQNSHSFPLFHCSTWNLLPADTHVSTCLLTVSLPHTKWKVHEGKSFAPIILPGSEQAKKYIY